MRRVRWLLLSGEQEARNQRSILAVQLLPCPFAQLVASPLAFKGREGDGDWNDDANVGERREKGCHKRKAYSVSCTNLEQKSYPYC